MVRERRRKLEKLDENLREPGISSSFGLPALEIASGAWLETFSGKEIFRHIRSQVPWKFPFENDEDLAYKLAEEWRRTKSTPQFIDTLRDAIIDGSGL